jgi:hypothetical protein
MVTVLAVTGLPSALLPDDAPDVGVPKAEMQEPTVTSAAVAETVCLKEVVEV